MLPEHANLIRQEDRMDLISLNSPFISDQPEDTSFEAIWDVNEDNEVRGWQRSSIDHVVRRLQRMGFLRLRVISPDDPPFPGNVSVQQYPLIDFIGL